MEYLEIEDMSTTSTQHNRLWESSSRSSDLEISVFYTIRNCITQFARVAAGLYHVAAESITSGIALKTLFFPPVPWILSRVFPSHFSTYYIEYLINLMHATCPNLMHVTCPTYLILLYFIILILFGGDYEF